MSDELERSRRLVLRDGVDETDVDDFAALIGWPRRSETAENREGWTARQVLWYAGPAVALTYCEDLLSGLGYVLITGVDDRVVRKTAELAEIKLNTWRLSELVRSVNSEEDPAGYAAAVLRLGLGSPVNLDEEFFQCVCKALGSDLPEARRSAVWAITYEPWPAYAAPLERLLEKEPDEDIAETARIVFEEMTGMGGSAT